MPMAGKGAGSIVTEEACLLFCDLHKWTPLLVEIWNDHQSRQLRSAIKFRRTLRLAQQFGTDVQGVGIDALAEQWDSTMKVQCASACLFNCRLQSASWEV